MTREEREDAINFLKGYLDEDVYTEKCINAHTMAIKSLEQQDILDKIRAEIEQTAKDYDKFDDYRRVRGLWIALEIIDKYK